jgi:hypothetical protein
MTLTNLENLERASQIHSEPPDQKEFDNLLSSAGDRLRDAHYPGLSPVSRFDLTYNAVYALALAALRWHGYRTDKRYLVFQCLKQTLNLDKAKSRVLTLCHDRRNRAAYEGRFEMDEQLQEELFQIGDELNVLVQKLGPVGKED